MSNFLSKLATLCVVLSLFGQSTALAQTIRQEDKIHIDFNNDTGKGPYIGADPSHPIKVASAQPQNLSTDLLGDAIYNDYNDLDNNTVGTSGGRMQNQFGSNPTVKNVIVANNITAYEASILIVTKTADTDDSVCDSDCSLREAIAAAGVGDTITFDSGLSGGFIYLASTLTLSKNVTINGSTLALKITISGDSDNNGTGNVRVFSVNSGVTATLSSLIITKGLQVGLDNNGGGINNHGVLMVTNSTLSNNSANSYGGGIFNDATLTLTNSMLSGNYSASSGSGLWNKGIATVTNTIFSDNSVAGNGSAIFNLNGGTLTITGSTFSDNSGGGSGAGIYTGGTATITSSLFSGNSATGNGFGSVTNSSEGTLTVANSTFTGNTSKIGAGITNFGLLTVMNSTLSGNSASYAVDGIYNDGFATMSYANTLIANSTVFEDCLNNGTMIMNTNNFVEDGTCAASLYGDPKLGPLADNGGVTHTFALLIDSPAIGAGDNSICAASAVGNLDQRGMTRPQGVQCDIGAYEMQYLTVTTNADPGDGTCDATCSLRDAITNADANEGVDFASSLSGATIHLNSTLSLSKNIMIDGSALATDISINGDTDNDDTGDVRVLHVNTTGVIAILDSLIITKGSASGEGGGLLTNSDTTVLVRNSTLSENFASDSGGAVSNYGFLTIMDSTISNNSAAEDAGGVLNNYSLILANSTFSNNNALGSGGGIYSTHNVTLTNSTFSGNSATAGGGIFTVEPLSINSSTFSGNSATVGGGLYIEVGTTHLFNTIIANSTSGGDCYGADGIGSNFNSLIEDGSCPSSLSGDPKLGPLADNGGTTQTFALLGGSPAIDAAEDTFCSWDPVYNLDQRYHTRPSGPHCDIGAFEVLQAEIDIKIGGSTQGLYSIAPGSSQRVNYSGVDSGPVEIFSRNAFTIIAAIRDAWQVNGVTTSFSQLMGLPLSQVSDTYVFPAYNNVSLNEQLRIGNVDTVPTTVTVTIGGVLRGTYDLDPDEAVRINYAGLDSGPVIVKGTTGVDIISAIREAWQVNGVTKSFVQVMGLPASQLSDKYVFPAYNNVTLNEQLRIGNVDTVPSTVTVTIGGVLRGTYDLDPNEAVRINYAGLDSGPVIVDGTDGVDIISSIRDAWQVNGVTTSFAQLMGMPAGGLSDTYIFPAYNNVTLNEQLRIGNVDTVPTIVTVTIGDVLRGTYDLAPDEAVRINYAGLDSGPVVVEGTDGVDIISAIREAWQTNGVTQSFVQLMGLPIEQLSTTYLFPAYNNVTLNEQLRFAVP